jgi:hypothetical protein
VLQHHEDISWSDAFDSVRTVYLKQDAAHAHDGTTSSSSTAASAAAASAAFASSTASATSPSTILLPNIGREQHSMLYHLVHRYETLAQRTVFMHGMHAGRSWFLDTARERVPTSLSYVGLLLSWRDARHCQSSGGLVAHSAAKREQCAN